MSSAAENEKTNKKNGKLWEVEESNYLNHGEEDEMEIYGYCLSRIHNTVMWMFIFLSLGLLRLVFHWWPEWMLFLSHKRCPLAQAEKVLVLDRYEKRFTSLFIKDVKRMSAVNQSLQEGQDQSEPMKRLDPYQLSRAKKSHPIEVFEIHLAKSAIKEVEEIRAIWVKKLCYIWDEDKNSFLKLVGLDQGVTKSQLHEYHGLDHKEQYMRRVIYGKNEILVKLQTILTLILLEVLNPFYIFQVFTICVWFAENYIYYTFAIMTMSLFGVSSAVIQTHQNQKNLHRTVHATDIVTVRRGDGSYEDIPTTHLVPGDVIVIPTHGCLMHCDAVLLVGNCIVNESMLTGESVPVTKTALPNENVLYCEQEDANHTLFCGTKVLQTRYYGNEKVHAVVVRTGFLTSKGSLVRSILYPPPADFKFDQDSYKFIWILAFIALIGLIYTIIIKSSRGLQPGDIILKALDIITIVIPPALPATMTIGKLYALSRLKKYQISCINSRVINVSGSIDCVCFDKTGTLTEDGLDMWGVVPVTNSHLHPPVRDVAKMPLTPLLYGMASCHSLTIIDGVVCGDPLDVKLFDSTGWIFEEPEIADTSKYDLMVPSVVRRPLNKQTDDEQPLEMGIIHQYQFSSKLQRMSVITRQLGSRDLTVYCKGSPEMIQSLSKPHSVPPNLMSALQEYTEQGYRVIAIGYRVLEELDYVKVQKMSRNEIEKDLEFLGLIIMENRLKPQTTGIISMLKGARIKVVMVTGDNILTAVSVAKECGIIEAGETVVEVIAEEENNCNPPQILYSCGGSLLKKAAEAITEEPNDLRDYEMGIKVTAPYRIAISGKSWAVIREHAPELIPRIAVRGAVFARMSSDQKQQLIQELQQLGYYVAMCGDGANDCGALKAAHAGISLSEAESSVASPFTSAIPNISCVPRVIREGRAALVTSFGVFKFMILYSIMEFMSTIILYSIDSNLTDFEFLFIDICLVVHLAFFFGRNKAYSGPLVPEVPLTSLLSRIPIMSLLLQIIVMSLVQLISFLTVQKYSWFEPFKYVGATYYISYENYAVFSVAQFQYIIMAFIFSQGAPYREPIYKNKIFFTSLCVMTCVCIYITVSPAQWLIRFLQLRFPPQIDFPMVVLMLALGNFVISTVLEMFVVNYLMFKKFRYCNHDLTSSRRKYLAVDRELDLDREWPQISTFGSVQQSGITGQDNLAFEDDVSKPSKYTTKL
ncbi:polyamine-transporting ATPase 13A3-like isoform X1 [Macrosteles quadrilineatus]|uniref:polyamine-transporting ATPase 13A3-like isoform X1 n=2 Tax=Macrosteles quadrilineatus TaxID=74068 RepID=UPI0023E25C04|nr:polyamine-transporting ATPase 13A3-like isoform X1 [Macrosteles quadrilineatus]XP_054266145.1 polyamine-transporting ATPase 13A3-like isoform X1 [Macrosteles quadrilineatus]